MADASFNRSRGHSGSGAADAPTNAAFDLAMQHYLGTDSIRSDHTKAREYMQAAAEGHPAYVPAMLAYSVMCLDSIGGAYDRPNGLKWCRAAADLGSGEAAFKFAQFSQFGTHGSANFVLAERYYNLAVARAVPGAADALKLLLTLFVRRAFIIGIGRPDTPYISEDVGRLVSLTTAAAYDVSDNSRYVSEWDKTSLRAAITEFFALDAAQHMLAFVGHAGRDGAWQINLKNDTISCAELYRMWVTACGNSLYPRRLFLYVDCCHSGSWVEFLRTRYESMDLAAAAAGAVAPHSRAVSRRSSLVGSSVNLNLAADEKWPAPTATAARATSAGAGTGTVIEPSGFSADELKFLCQTVAQVLLMSNIGLTSSIFASFQRSVKNFFVRLWPELAAQLMITPRTHSAFAPTVYYAVDVMHKLTTYHLLVDTFIDPWMKRYECELIWRNTGTMGHKTRGNVVRTYHVMRVLSAGLLASLVTSCLVSAARAVRVCFYSTANPTSGVGLAAAAPTAASGTADPRTATGGTTAAATGSSELPPSSGDRLRWVFNSFVRWFEGLGEYRLHVSAIEKFFKTVSLLYCVYHRDQKRYPRDPPNSSMWFRTGPERDIPPVRMSTFFWVCVVMFGALTTFGCGVYQYLNVRKDLYRQQSERVRAPKATQRSKTPAAANPASTPEAARR